MSTPVIKVENLSKYYRLGLIGGGTLREDVNRWIAKVSGKTDPLLMVGEENHGNREDGQIWALKDINLEVNEGEILGIIGCNGAGKSTLLKILSKITAPTKGCIKIRGRVGSLLEVGTGFHPELTGRENIYLNGTILGMTHAEVTSKLEEIVEFAEMSKFIDTPVKRYSSGMRVRLAFAVAAHLEPEILVVDEVLAVGDASFQKKCLGKMKDVVGHGRTVLFVSHNMQIISRLTDRCVLLSGGSILFDGSTEDGVSTYLNQDESKTAVYNDESNPPHPHVVRAEVKTSDSKYVHRNGQSLELVFHVKTPFKFKNARFAVIIKNSFGENVINCALFDTQLPIFKEKGVSKLVCTIPVLRLYMGHYSLSVRIAAEVGQSPYQVLENICPFEVTMIGKNRDYPWTLGMCMYTEDFYWEMKV